jgi:glutamate dehydrogenase
MLRFNIFKRSNSFSVAKFRLSTKSSKSKTKSSTSLTLNKKVLSQVVLPTTPPSSDGPINDACENEVKILLEEMNQSQIKTSEKVVPWFFDQMPPSYFRQVDSLLRKQHLSVVVSAQELGQSDITVKISHERNSMTHDITFLSIREPAKSKSKSNSNSNSNSDSDSDSSINNPKRIGSLATQLSNLNSPEGTQLTRVKIFNSKDHSISVNIFTFETSKAILSGLGTTEEECGPVCDYINTIRTANVSSVSVNGEHIPKYNEKIFGSIAMKEYFQRISPVYCKLTPPRKFLNQWFMSNQVLGTDDTKVLIEPFDSGGAWITVASNNISALDMIKVTSSILAFHGLYIEQTHLDTVLDITQISNNDKYVVLLRYLVDDKNLLKPIVCNNIALKSLEYHLSRVKWIDEEVLELAFLRKSNIGINVAEVIHGFYSMLHGAVSSIHPQSYASVKNMHRMIENDDYMFSLSCACAQLFLDRFIPDHLVGNPLTENEFQIRLNDLKDKIDVLNHEAARTLLLKCTDVIKFTLRTNFFNEKRYSFALRMDPIFLVPSDIPMPFGVIFACGRNFQFYHTRFKDISRGGFRVVTPPTTAQHGVESSRIFGECYGLSYAQQLKNKDIPEGGSKAVCLVNVTQLPESDRYEEARKAIRASVDAILDLTVDDSIKSMKDFYSKQEIIYLGPDEQVTIEDIDWICNRAKLRGYPFPSSFMSGKVGAGINHKEYGVTSEGIVIYLKMALKRVLGINPYTTPFSVKITGGPDGDVGGNLIKILFREFPNTAKIVGVADGMGVAEDPNGLHSKELLRLCHEGKPIIYFNKHFLSPNGIVMDASDNDEGTLRRDTMMFRVKSDVFVPCGGRPGSLHGKNWKKFLLPDGTSSSPLIVEGANIFITPEARQSLYDEAGVTIIKDSSANKCGVVASSMEIQMSMLLSEDEFMKNKKLLSKDVIDRLHYVSKNEANLLLDKCVHYPGSLPGYSERVSNAINSVTDSIILYLEDVHPGDPLWDELMPVMKNNLSSKLVDLAWDRALEKLPVQYIKNAIASSIAANMVYQEGVHLVEIQPVDQLAHNALRYYRKNRTNLELISKIKSDYDNNKVNSLETHERVIKLLKKGGTLSACDFL